MEAVENSENEFPTAPTGPQGLVYKGERETKSAAVNRRRITAPQVDHFLSGVRLSFRAAFPASVCWPHLLWRRASRNSDELPARTPPAIEITDDCRVKARSGRRDALDALAKRLEHAARANQRRVRRQSLTGLAIRFSSMHE